MSLVHPVTNFHIFGSYVESFATDGAQRGNYHVQSKDPKICPDIVLSYSMQLPAILYYFIFICYFYIAEAGTVFCIYLSDFIRRQASTCKIPHENIAGASVFLDQGSQVYGFFF